MCRVLNKHHAGVPAGAVYIGRGSKWGNPFRIGPDGDRAAVIAKYERWLADQHQLLRALDELRGRDLVCWCAPRPCHGDLLLRLANTPRDVRIACGGASRPLPEGPPRPLALRMKCKEENRRRKTPLPHARPARQG
jgi:hypothetical protein